MLVQILDAAAEPHFVAWRGVDQINDYSGSLGSEAVGPTAAFQQVLPANTIPAGAAGCRCGWLFQNTSQSSMILNEINNTSSSSWVIPSGGFFPPPDYPVVPGLVQVMGTADSQEGDSYACREFVNGPNE